MRTNKNTISLVLASFTLCASGQLLAPAEIGMDLPKLGLAELIPNSEYSWSYNGSEFTSRQAGFRIASFLRDNGRVLNTLCTPNAMPKVFTNNGSEFTYRQAGSRIASFLGDNSRVLNTLCTPNAMPKVFTIRSIDELKVDSAVAPFLKPLDDQAKSRLLTLSQKIPALFATTEPAKARAKFDLALLLGHVSRMDLDRTWLKLRIRNS